MESIPVAVVQDEAPMRVALDRLLRPALRRWSSRS
jgi:hypothetical protein